MTTAPATPRWPRGRLRRIRDGSDRGSAAVEAVIIIPVIVILSMLVIQFALVWHGRHLAQAAAQAAVTAAAGYRADPALGPQAADEYLAQVAPHLLTGPYVTVTRGTTAVSATVRAHVLTVVPFADFTIDATAAGPTEVFDTAGAP